MDELVKTFGLTSAVSAPLGSALQFLRASHLPNWSIYPASIVLAIGVAGIFGGRGFAFADPVFQAQATLCVLVALSSNRVTSDAAHGSKFGTRDPEKP